ncbi:hypothetical protein VTK73DRAFT_8458 [Phialemonium thermophilum]|uniref:Uncharacterized protein n=1 Tax=Phialemonium thermophilum TaxID=223376 RepID=A0ABR3W8K6_9PEZI
MAAEETPSHDISILIPKAAFKASVGQIKDLLYLYRSRYEDTNPTMLNHTGMIHVLYELFRDGRATDTYFYFLLCIHGYLELGRCMPVAGKVMRDIHRTGTRMGSSLLEASSNLFESIQTSEASIGQRAPFTGSGRAAAAFQAGVNIGGVEVAHEQHPLELRSQQDHDNQQQQQHQHFQKKPNWPQVVYMPSDMSTHFRGSRQLRLGTVEVDGDDEDVQTVHRAAQSVSHVDLKVLGGHGAARQGSGRGITHMQDPGPRVWKGDPRSLQETLSDGQMYHDL